METLDQLSRKNNDSLRCWPFMFPHKLGTLAPDEVIASESILQTPFSIAALLPAPDVPPDEGPSTSNTMKFSLS